MKTYFFALLGLFVVSCASNKVDSKNKDSGLFGTVEALNSGQYNKKIIAKEQRLKAVQKQGQSTKDKAIELQKLKQINKAKAHKLQMQVDVSSRRNQKLKSDVDRLTHQLNLIEHQRHQQENQMELLNQQEIKNQLDQKKERDAKKRRLAKLQKDRDALRKQLELLLKRDF